MDRVLSGGVADLGGLKSGQQITCINGVAVRSQTYVSLFNRIRERLVRFCTLPLFRVLLILMQPNFPRVSESTTLALTTIRVNNQ